MAGHVAPLKTYFATFGALMVLTGVTVGAAFVDLGPMNIVVALGIAALKGSLVVLYFMHVKYGYRLVWLYAAAGFYWLGIMIVLTMADIVGRGFPLVPGK